MAFGAELSNPARFGYGQSTTDDRNLFLKIFGGEVLAAFNEAVVFKDKQQTRQIQHGKSAQFPKTWKAVAEYHTAGQEMLGNDIDTGEVTITIDGLLVAHTAIYDLDEKIAHFDVTGEFSKQLGLALAKAYDKNVARSIILAARTAADGPFPGGERIVDAALTNSGTIDGKAWIDAIREANIKLFDKDVPEEQPRYMTVNAAVFDAMKYATDANGRYLVLDRDINAGAKSVTGGRIQALDIEGVTVIRSRLLPNADESADTSVYPKYRANYANTTGILWTPMAVGTLELMGVSMETERDVRRQEDFMVAKMAVGSGTLRPECAIEFAVL